MNGPSAGVAVAVRQPETARSGERVRERGQTGFVLPYVLATVAILSLIAVLGANTLRDGQRTVRQLERRAAIELAMNDAESIVLSRFSTAPLVTEGMYLGAQTIVTGSDLMTGEAEKQVEVEPELVWDARGGTRRLDLNGVTLIVAYQDISGLVSLYSASKELLARLLLGPIEAEAEAQALIAKLGDFTDSDNARQFTGGERADYRLAGLAPPTNSPLRTAGELGAILGWQDKSFFLEPAFLDSITFFSTGATPRLAGMPPGLDRRLLIDSRRLNFSEDELIDGTVMNAVSPSERARFTITALSADRTFGLRRIIEAEKTGGAPDFPVSRRLIAEYTMMAPEIGALDPDVVPALVLSASDDPG